ncbi:bacteriocin immunity protein [Lactiplantibacillus mudanjiangensis]
MVAVKLSNAITRYSLQHKLTLPKAINELYGVVEHEANAYRRKMSMTMWL